MATLSRQPQWPFIKFYQGRPAYGRFVNNGRFFQLEDQAVAVLAVSSIRSAQMARSVNLGCGWSISYCPAQAVYQRPSQAFLERAGKASGR